MSGAAAWARAAERAAQLVGRRFGRLVVREFLGRTPNRCALYLCQCDCGGLTKVQGQRLTIGTTRSCGCFRREETAERSRSRAAARAVARAAALAAAPPAPRSQVRLRVASPYGLRTGPGERRVCARDAECLDAFVRAHAGREGHCPASCAGYAPADLSDEARRAVTGRGTDDRYPAPVLDARTTDA